MSSLWPRGAVPGRHWRGVQASLAITGRWSEMTQPASTLPAIIDAHSHALPDWLASNLSTYLPKDQTLRVLFDNPKARIVTVDKLVEAAAAARVSASVVAGFGWNDIGLARECNDSL